MGFREMRHVALLHDIDLMKQYVKQDQQRKAAFNEREPQMLQQQKPVERSPEGPQTKTGQGTRQSMGKFITKIIHKKK
jgi:hypothetical protein